MGTGALPSWAYVFTFPFANFSAWKPRARELPSEVAVDVAAFRELLGDSHGWLDLSDRSDRSHFGDLIVFRPTLTVIAMTIGVEATDVVVETTDVVERSPIIWKAAFGGAVVGVGVAAVLDAFGAAIGLAVSSAAPTWRDASFALAFLSGLYLILAALVSYGVGGYVAARLRPPVLLLADQRELRDGYCGLTVWGLMTVASVILLALAAAAVPRLAAPSGSGNGPAASVAGENIIAFDLDRLFRDMRPTRAPLNISYERAEAARILLTTSSHRGMLPDDRS